MKYTSIKMKGGIWSPVGDPEAPLFYNIRISQQKLMQFGHLNDQTDGTKIFPKNLFIKVFKEKLHVFPLQTVVIL